MTMLARRAALLAGMFFAVQAHALKADRFDDVREILNRQWTQWTNRCGDASELEVDAATRLDQLTEAFGRQERCLMGAVREVGRRNSAQPLVNAEIWKDLTDAQKKTLEDDLAGANQKLIDRIQAFQAAQSRIGMVKADELQRLQAAARKPPPTDEEQGLTSYADALSCARRFEALTETEKKLGDQGDEIRQAQQELRDMSFRVDMIKLRPHTAYEYNDAARVFNNRAREVERRTDRFNDRVKSFEKDGESYRRSCQDNLYSKQTRDRLCEKREFPNFCRGFR